MNAYPRAARVDQADRDLTVLFTPRRARVLALHAYRRCALLHIPGLVHYQDRSRITQVPRNITPQVIAQPAVIYHC